MNRYFKTLLLSLALIALQGCGTTDGALQEQGRSESYVQGFHDGRHSGMQEAGNEWEHYLRDHEKFTTSEDYREGWLAGEAEGKRLQQQAQSIGNSIGSGYSGYKVGKEIDKNAPDPEQAAKDAMKGVDPAVLNQLGK